MVTGWHDIFLPAQLADYAVLRDAGRAPHLRIGPWTHGSPGLLGAALREGLVWLRPATCALPVPPLTTRSVRVHVGGTGGGWRDLPDWPPPSRPVVWHLAPAAGSTLPRPAPPRPRRLRYDPADPTPSLGGPLLVGQRAGPVRQPAARGASRRAGVHLRRRWGPPSTLVGPVSATVYVRSELPHFDVFVRLCDVDAAGRS